MPPNPIRVAVLRSLWAGGRLEPLEKQPTWPDDFLYEVFQGDNGGSIREEVFQGDSGWSIRDYWNRAAFGLLRLEFDLSVAPQWRRLAEGETQAKLKGDRGAILAACRRAAEQDGVALANYDKVVAFVHPGPCDAGAVDGGAVFDQGGSIPFFQHELGHVLGFQHAFGPLKPPPDEYGSLYNDPYCVMGYTDLQAHSIEQPSQFSDVDLPSGFWRSDRRASAASLYRRFRGTSDFVNSGWVAHTEAGQRVTVTALCEAGSTSPVVAVVPVPDKPDALLAIEYRTNVGDDEGVDPAVVIHSIGVGDVGVGRSEVDPPWFEGTISPAVGASLSVLGLKCEIVAVNSAMPRLRASGQLASPASVEVQVIDQSWRSGPVEEMPLERRRLDQ